MQVVKVLLPQTKLFPLNYITDLEVSLGDLVLVTLKDKKITGIIIELDVKTDNLDKLKKIVSKNSFELNISLKEIEFIKKLAKYYVSELGSVAKMVLPVELNEKPYYMIEQVIENEFSLASLNNDQKIVYEKILNSTDNLKKYSTELIHGATGSGKTEIYFNLIARALKDGKQVLLMLPEIALTQQLLRRFKERFCFEPEIWNSSIKKSSKKKILRGIISGTVKFIIGSRSSLMLPYNDLGLIIVDEEHDSSYKQEEGVLYNSRDMSVLKGKIFDFPVILCSATPSLESYYNSTTSKYNLHYISSRYQASLPEVNIIDMTKDSLPLGLWISETLKKEIAKNLSINKQTLIFINRKGYAPLVLCRDCGYRFECSKCSSWLVLHKGKKRLKCHHCGYITSLVDLCPECNMNDTLAACGPGIERIEEELKIYFKDAVIKTITKDISSNNDHINEIIKNIENHEVDIIIGTQIIAKGYHFPKITLVGVIDADIGFYSPHVKSAEKSFQLIHQVGGRAGREAHSGKVFLQTYYPDSKVCLSLKNGDIKGFYDFELDIREQSLAQPFFRVVVIILSGKQEVNVKNYARVFAEKMNSSDYKIYGPIEASIYKLNNKFRYKIQIHCKKNYKIQEKIMNVMSNMKTNNSVHIKVDIDPYTDY